MLAWSASDTGMNPIQGCDTRSAASDSASSRTRRLVKRPAQSAVNFNTESAADSLLASRATKENVAT
jgi:hypothetical protein